LEVRHVPAVEPRDERERGDAAEIAAADDGA
jgi:hypothetical protein